MSGGHFNYKQYDLFYEMFGFGADKDIIGKKNAPNIFGDQELSNLTYDLLNLISDFDWYVSGDTDKEDWLEARDDFKKKWFKTSRKESIKNIIDNSCEALKQELYETFDLKE